MVFCSFWSWQFWSANEWFPNRVMFLTLLLLMLDYFLFCHLLIWLVWCLHFPIVDQPLPSHLSTYYFMPPWCSVEGTQISATSSAAFTLCLTIQYIGQQSFIISKLVIYHFILSFYLKYLPIIPHLKYLLRFIDFHVVQTLHPCRWCSIHMEKIFLVVNSFFSWSWPHLWWLFNCN